MAKDIWTSVSMHPLTGLLDLRSRPADIPSGAFRMKLNAGVSDTGNLLRRPGWERFYADLLFDNNGVPLSTGGDHVGVIYHNSDHHHQGAAREAITLLFESTSSTGDRRLYDGTQSRISYLNEATGYWTDIATGKGSFRSRWQAAELKDNIIFTNNVDDILYHDITTTTAQFIPELKNSRHITKAKVVVSYQGFILLMNIERNGVRASTAIVWSDLNLPLSWNLTSITNGIATLSSFQDLPYGDEILAAKELLGALYIYTRRAIWRCSLSGSGAGSVFSFVRVYNEPKNQTGCLTYPNTLVSDGLNHWYLNRDGWYRYNAYLPAPERDPVFHLATGAIFTDATTRMTGLDCEEPVAEYIPSKGEIWVSWPSGGRLTNNWTLALNLPHKTADLIDEGFTAMINYRRAPTGTLCNETQDFIAVCGTDWAIKSIGTVFYRNTAAIIGNDITTDLPLNSPDAVYLTRGYYSILRGLMPLAFTDRTKLVREVLIDHDTSEQSDPCALRLRVGNSNKLVDPNSLATHCAPLWRQMPDRLLECPDAQSLATMKASNLRPDTALRYKVFEQGIFLYFELIIANQDGTPAIGGDTAFQRFDFDVKALPKP